jgi:hypothetical protein
VVYRLVTAHNTTQLWTPDRGTPVRLDQAPGLGLWPGLEMGLGTATPADLLLKASHPFGMSNTKAISRSPHFFSYRLGLWARAPVCRALSIGPQALQRLADDFSPPQTLVTPYA